MLSIRGSSTHPQPTLKPPLRRDFSLSGAAPQQNVRFWQNLADFCQREPSKLRKKCFQKALSTLNTQYLQIILNSSAAQPYRNGRRRSMTLQTRNTTRRRTPFTYYYVWTCRESTEVRGSGGSGNTRADGSAPRARIPACGHANIRRTRLPIDQQHRPQAKCEACGRRQRLHEGMTHHRDFNHWEYHEHHMGEERRPQGQRWTASPTAHSRSRTGPPNIEARKEWAEQRKADLNEALLSVRSNMIEQTPEILEHGGEILE